MKLQTLLALLTKIYDLHGDLEVDLMLREIGNDPPLDYSGPLSGIALSPSTVTLTGTENE